MKAEIARGILDGNLIETNFRNHGELSRWNDNSVGHLAARSRRSSRRRCWVLVSGRVPGETGQMAVLRWQGGHHGEPGRF